MDSHLPDDGAREIDESDRAAARRALARNWPALEQSSQKYAAMLEALASLHRQGGAEKFELRYNLRPPKDRTEEWARELMHGQISQDEFERRVKADAERPIDLEMLKAFCDAYRERLSQYSSVLQLAVLTPQQANDSRYCRAAEKAIDDHVAAMKEKFPLWSNNLETVFDFLEELRVSAGGGLLKLGEFEGTSSHWLAELVFTRVEGAWKSCRDISNRSQSDPRYLYAAHAIDLFQRWLPKLPAPQSLNERLREEFVLARLAVKRQTGVAPVDGSATGGGTSSANDDLDNESRELMLIGDMFSVVGKAGHIFRPTPNSDWGIDGEIEFKDRFGRASGRRVYVQLKSGDSYLRRRVTDGVEVFDVKNVRHLEYWGQQSYPVMLVVRNSTGVIRWMDISAYLKLNGSANRQIIFAGEPVTAASLQAVAAKLLDVDPSGC